jgi:dihydroxyacetone kinase-like predicted kinase
MGADVAILCEESASPKEFLDAFEKVTTPEILVFPNSSDSVLSAMQAKKLYDNAIVTVIPTRGIAECYASLPIIDFAEEDTKAVADAIAETTNNLYVVNIARRKNTVDPGSPYREEYYAFSRKDILTIGNTLEETAVQTIDKAMRKYSKDIITIFHGKNVRREQLDNITNALELLGICAEVFLVPLEKASSELILSFE